VLTDGGWDKVVATAPGHVEEVQRLVFDNLTPARYSTSSGSVSASSRPPDRMAHSRYPADASAMKAGRRARPAQP
jgi:hypothetical protein